MSDVPEVTPDAAQPIVDQAVADAPAPNPTVASTTAPLIPADRPELAVGAAFAGGLVLAKLFKRLGR